MPLQPSGRVVRDRGGLEVIVERRLPVASPEVWRWLTAPSRTKRWTTATLVELEPGERAEAVGDGWGAILSLAPDDHGCILYAKERVASSRDAAGAGPRWEHALDRLVAAMTGADAPPSLERYAATQRPYYERLAMDGDPVPWPPS